MRDNIWPAGSAGDSYRLIPVHEFPDMLYAEAKGCVNGGKGTKRGFVTFAAKHSSREMSTFRRGLLDNLLDGLQFLT